MKKKCTKCGETKESDQFNVKRRKKDGSIAKQAWCKSCNKQNLKKHYVENLEHYKLRKKKRLDKIVGWFKEFKKTLKCSECGESRTPCLDFHHIDNQEKDGTVCMIVRAGSSIETIKKEIEKCIILCANCHRMVHSEEVQSPVV